MTKANWLVKSQVKVELPNHRLIKLWQDLFRLFPPLCQPVTRLRW